MPEMTGAGWEAVSALLDELLDLDPAGRTARLAEIRAQNPALSDHVAGLLAHHQSVREERFLEESAVDPLGLSELAGRSFGGLHARSSARTGRHGQRVARPAQ